MAFKFNAILKFNSEQAVKGMDTASKAFTRLQANIKKAGAAMGKIGQGLQGAALAGAPLTAGVALATKTYADFEFQMKTVQAALLATDEEMVELISITKLLGATTEFSAKQAGEGADNLARAGFTTQEVINALPGVLAAASAGGVDLATASDIVVGQLGAFGLEASKAAEVADQLALTTSLTSTDFVQLGESMKFAAPIAKAAGLTLSQTASAMGVLANAGVKGSLAGTALKNSLMQLSKPTKGALELFGGQDGLNKAVLETVEVNGKLVQRLKPMEVIMANVSQIVASAKNPLEATAQAAEIFGLRGTTAFNAFQAALTKTIPITDKNRDAIVKGAKAVGENVDEFLAKGAIPQLVALRLNIEGAAGTAQKMRDIKLNSLTGQFIMLESAVEGVSLEIGGIFAGVTKGVAAQATDFFSVLTVGFQAAVQGGKATEAQLAAIKDNQFKELTQATIEFAQGFISGFNEIKKAATDTWNTIIGRLRLVFGETAFNNKELGSMVAKFVILGAVAAPIVGTLAAGLFVIGPIISGISGLFTIAGMAMQFGLIKPVLFLIAKMGGLQAIVTGIGSVLAKVLTVAGAKFIAIGALIAGIVAAVGALVMNFNEIKTAFMEGGIISGFKAWGDAIMRFVGAPLKFVLDKLSPIATLLGFNDDKIKPAGQQGAMPTVGQGSGIVQASGSVQQDSLKQMTMLPEQISQTSAVPASASSSSSSSGGGKGGTTTQRIELTFKGDAKKVFNKMVTESQVENAALKGRTPANKRKLIQNGAAAQ